MKKGQIQPTLTNKKPTNLLAVVFLVSFLFPTATFGLLNKIELDKINDWVGESATISDQIMLAAKNLVTNNPSLVLGETLATAEDNPNIEIGEPNELNTPLTSENPGFVLGDAISNDLEQRVVALENKLNDPIFLASIKGEPGLQGPAGPMGPAGSSATNAPIPAIQYIYANTIAQPSTDPHNVTSVAAMNLSGETLVVKKADIGEWAELRGTLNVGGATTLNGTLTVSGDTSFSGNLDVSGSATIPTLNASTTNLGYLLAYNNATTTGSQYIGSDLTVAGSGSIRGDLSVVGTINQSGGSFTGATTTVTGDFTVQDANASTLFFADNNNQRIGIATTTPGGYYGEKLTVAGGAYITGGATTTALRAASLNVNGDDITDITGNGLSIVNGALSNLAYGTPGSWENIWTNTLTPTSTTAGIFVNASSTINANFRVQSDLAEIPKFVVGSSTAPALYVASNGYVGIGTATPAHRLAVDGNMILTGQILPQTAGTSTPSVTVDSNYDVGSYSTVVLGADGFPRISYRDDTNSDLKFAQCTSVDCSTSNITTVDSTGNVGRYTSLALGQDGFARIAYYDSTNGDLKFAQCTSVDCSTSNITTVDSTGNVGFYTSLALGADGFARIAYYDSTNSDLKFVQCTNDDCSTKVITAVTAGGYMDTSIAMGADGYARISANDASNSQVVYVQCANDSCSSNTVTVVAKNYDNGNWFMATDIAVGSDGYARIAYSSMPKDVNDLWLFWNGNVNLVRCTNDDCSVSVNTQIDTGGSVGIDSWRWDGRSVSLDLTSTDLPRIAYYDQTYGRLKYAECYDLDCKSKNISVLDDNGQVGGMLSLVLDAQELPVISYHDYRYYTLKLYNGSYGQRIGSSVARWQDIYTEKVNSYSGSFAGNLTVSGNIQSGQSILPLSDGSSGFKTLIDGNLIGHYRAYYPSMDLDANGFANISYSDHTNYDLKFAQCTNADCSTKNITTVDSAGSVGYFPSLALGTDTYARIAYYNNSSDDLKFAQCTNADCSSKNITTVDSTGNVGLYSSIALGTDTYARIAYNDYTNADLKFAQCTNDDCSTKNITTIDSGFSGYQRSSITMGSDGYARIAYTATSDHKDYVKLLVCANDDCSSKTTTTVFDGESANIFSVDMALASGDLPKIVYSDYGETRLVVCQNTTCTQNRTEVLARNNSSDSISIHIDSNDFAVVAFDDYYAGEYQSNIYLAREANEGGQIAVGDYSSLFSLMATNELFSQSLNNIGSVGIGQRLTGAETALQVNTGSGFSGDLLKLQNNGSSKFAVDANGKISIATSTAWRSNDWDYGLSIATTTMIYGTTTIGNNTLVVNTNEGRVGIGTASPRAKLEIAGSALTATSSAVKISNGFSDGVYMDFGDFRKIGVFDGGNFFMGYNFGYDTTNNTYEYDATDHAAGVEYTIDGDINFLTAISGDVGTDFTPTSRLIVKNNGQVGVATTTPWADMELAVNGDIMVTGDIYKAGAAYVNPDYVFAQYFENPYDEAIPEDYSLLSLNELEDYVKDNSHLPGVSFNGGPISIFEANRLNLEKIEELSIYAIELNKRLGLIENGASVQNTSLEIPATPIEDIVVLNHPLTVEGDLVVKGQSYFNADSVGQAKILSGTTTVEIVFEEEYEYLPIVTAIARNFIDGQYRVATTTAESFIIELSETQSEDIIFNWHAFASPEAKLFISDGTIEDIQLSINNNQSTTGDPIVTTPVIDNSSSPSTTEVNPDAGVVAGDSTVSEEETTTEETPTEQPPTEQPTTEETPAEEPAIEQPTPETPVVETPGPVVEPPPAETPVVELPVEEVLPAEPPAEALPSAESN